ncbi:MAG TPA: phosphate ABC transporter ATP-binding protein [Actinophytocola sp.]|uniref:ABC transporter ATP-binding protein n=1 Tax=Actinophytocola sp. TaxID=1872138 RepID=UPI002DB84F1E|nr:phosphate ABC transporter ATP-binding protein [Actinophytocola sp.]HEU5470809.1 phosphate ABC transporter ATP-binding protein [Actinophytocola sp.]
MAPEGFTFDRVVVDRGGVRALDGFSGEVPGIGVTVLFGPSGSGKTTLLRLCNRLEIPTSGRVLFRGHDVAGLDPLRLRRTVGMVFQRPTPFPGTVRENLLIAAPDAGAAQLVDALEQAALDGSWLDRDATELSGGEAQRVCVARTLVTRPEVLLLDEPTSALDRAAAGILERTVRALAARGIAALWVSHDPAQVRRIADRVLRIEHGRAVEPTTEEVEG